MNLTSALFGAATIVVPAMQFVGLGGGMPVLPEPQAAP